MGSDYLRRCPSCGTDNAATAMRCACGALLAGVDLTRAQQPAPVVAAPDSLESPVAQSVVCGHADCAQSNPVGSKTCLYCDRPLNAQPADALQSLITLPGKLKDQYRILQPLATKGSEAELLLVQSVSGGPTLVAKIYRHGVHPRPEVMQRIGRIDARYCVQAIEAGTEQGYAYELMEYCAEGSLRELLRAGPMALDTLREVLRQIAAAIAAVHAVGLLHRDLKPENVLVRKAQPLELVLTDFGISSVLEATQRFTGTARTLPYASPESLSGVIDVKADYWALGIVLLEARLGKHPFSGLSDPVVLHHLTTRAIDLSEVADARLRKLLRGLLLRDPKERWGANEIVRWLANDPSLAEPLEQGVGHSFAQPYRIGGDCCYSPEQLAVGLARNWKAGVADIANGLLLTWFREVQADQNVVRLLLSLRHESGLPADLQLLQLILQLAPGIPAVWRGEALGLRAVLTQANAALKGDAEAVHWLHQLYQYRVLQSYAQAGNAECADIVERWSQAADRFDQAWQQGLARIREQGGTAAAQQNGYVDVHQLLYGKSEPDRPALSGMHARLLAVAYDAVWGQRLRSRLTAELAHLTLDSPWLADLGNPQTMETSDLLVLESLLPEARKAAQLQIEANARKEEEQASECAAMAVEFQLLIAQVHSAGRASLMMPAACSHLAACLDSYFDLVARISASGRADLQWQSMRKAAVRAKPVANQLRQKVDELLERRAADAGWFSREVAIFAGLVLLLAPIFLAPNIRYLLLAGALAVACWRLGPTYFLMRDIRELAGRLSTWTRPAPAPSPKAADSARDPGIEQGK